MTQQGAARVFHPRNILQELLSRPGGKDRDQCITAALEQIESLRRPSLDAVDRAIAAIETMAREHAAGLSRLDLANILQQGDLIVSIAGTYGHANLDMAARSLCDLAHALIEKERHDAEPIVVHARALRLFSSRAQPLTQAEAELVFAELARFRAHFGATCLLAADTE
ncbi:MAG TPA: hypothetical protein VGF97_01575 [Rhizomicrobium sp.]|jgi:hypothetical protein